MMAPCDACVFTQLCCSTVLCVCIEIRGQGENGVDTCTVQAAHERCCCNTHVFGAASALLTRWPMPSSVQFKLYTLKQVQKLPPSQEISSSSSAAVHSLARQDPSVHHLMHRQLQAGEELVVPCPAADKALLYANGLCTAGTGSAGMPWDAADEVQRPCMRSTPARMAGAVCVPACLTHCLLLP